MSQKPRTTEIPRDNREVTEPADKKTQMPNLEDWMGEIEEFASEISGDLNSITEMLGERSITLGRPATSSADAWNPPRGNDDNSARHDTGTGSAGSDNEDEIRKSATGSERKQLSSLKQRLAEMKSANEDFGQNFSNGGSDDDQF